MMNLYLTKRSRPGEAKCVVDYPCTIDRKAVQLVPFVPNVITSTQMLGPHTILDNVESAYMTKVATGFKICKLFAFTKRVCVFCQEKRISLMNE